MPAAPGTPRTDQPRRLLIVSHVRHYAHRGRLFAYGPYAREIDIWADLFSRVVIAAPCRDEAPSDDCLPFTRSNITIAPQRETGGMTLRAKIVQVFSVPALLVGLGRAMRQTDAIHVRCPGNLGLLGVVLAPLFSRLLIAKYAGQWNGYAGEPWASRMQRLVLRSPWWRGPVVVYGSWPGQPAHVVPFFTSIMTAEHVGRAVQQAQQKAITLPLRVLFTGRLAPEKRVSALLRALKMLVDRDVPVELVVAGDGPERENLRGLAARLGIDTRVRFVGALAFEAVLSWYEWARCFVLPSSSSEGWPKALAEAMCFGCVCLAVAHGQVSSMLDGRGIVLKTGTPEEIAATLEAVARSPEQYAATARRASDWARQYSLEGLRDALCDLLTQRWGVQVAASGALSAAANAAARPPISVR